MMDAIRWFLTSHPRIFVGWRAILMWLGHRSIPFLRPRLEWMRRYGNDMTWAEIESLGIRPGDIIGVRSRRFWTSYLIPGKFKHTAVYTGNGFIIHAVSPKVCEMGLFDFLAEYDGFVILRPRPPYDWKKADRAAFLAIKSDYDFVFTSGNAAFYCHELAAHVVHAGGVNVPKPHSCYSCDDIATVSDVVLEV